MTKDRNYVEQRSSLPKDGSVNTIQNSIGKNIDFVGALGSHIGYSSGYLAGARGQQLNSKTILKYQRIIRLHQNRARLEGNATHLRTMIAFTRVFNSLSISKDIKYRSLHLYWKHANRDNRITNHVLLIALCLLQAIREAKDRAPIRFSEIIEAFSCNGHRVTNRNILRLARELNVSLSPISRKPEDYIDRIASQIRNDPEICEKLQDRRFSPGQYESILILLSKHFLKSITRNQRGGVQPYPFTVSIIYLADRAFAKSLKRKPILTQKLLAKIADSAEFTIRDHVYRFLGDLYKQCENSLIEAVNAHFANGPMVAR
jgi:transcription initiation factor TFIIIB Brf1 subunit/transcription initiation factor TFIIB